MARWVQVDTRLLASEARAGVDGYVHQIPKAMAPIHELDLTCWCDPRCRWPEEGHTLIVTHRDYRPTSKGWVEDWE